MGCAKKKISSSLPIPLSKYTLRDKLSLLFDLQSYSSHMVCIPYKLHLLLFFKNAILYILLCTFLINHISALTGRAASLFSTVSKYLITLFSPTITADDSNSEADYII